MGTQSVVSVGPGINYAEVIGDLRSRAARLMECAAVLEGAMMREEPLAAVAPERKLAAKPAVRKIVKTRKTRVLPGLLQESAKVTDEAPRTPPPAASAEPSNRDIVRQILAERVDRTKFEIADHALRVRPALRRTDVLTILSQLRASGEAIDKDDLYLVAGPNLRTPYAGNGAGH